MISLSWVLMAVGAVLLGFGLYKSGPNAGGKPALGISGIGLLLLGGFIALAN